MQNDSSKARRGGENELGRIESRIFVVRGEKVLFDFDLAALYQVETRVLIQSVKRNRERFPEDFMFQLSTDELRRLTSQVVMSNASPRGGARRPPYAFTEQGVAMLSSVLRSPRAVDVNIQIMRTFVRLRALMLTHRDLATKLDELEKKYDRQFAAVFDAIRQLMTPPDPPRKPIGFRHGGTRSLRVTRIPVHDSSASCRPEAPLGRSPGGRANT